MQPSVLAADLRVLTEAWRLKAGRIELLYGVLPKTSEALKAAFETCAEEIEELVKAAEAKKP